MDDTTVLRAQLKALRDVRASGTLRVEFGERSVTYRSDHELLAAINDIERRLASSAGRRVRTVRIHSSKGF